MIEAPEYISILNNVGWCMRKIRRDRKLSVREVVSDIQGISISTLSGFESGERPPSLRMLIKLCCHYQVRLSEVLRMAENEAFPRGGAPWK